MQAERDTRDLLQHLRPGGLAIDAAPLGPQGDFTRPCAHHLQQKGRDCHQLVGRQLKLTSDETSRGGFFGRPARRKKLRAAIANHLSPLRSRPAADYIRVFLAHRHELPPASRHTIASLARTYQQLVEQLFVDGIASGQLRSDLPPRLAALAFLGLCNSVISNRSMPRSSTIDVIIEEYARILVGGMMADAKERQAPPRGRSRNTRGRRAAAGRG